MAYPEPEEGECEDFVCEAMYDYNVYPLDELITPTLDKIQSKLPSYKEMGLIVGGDDSYSDLACFIYGACLGKEFIRDPYSKEILKAVKYWIEHGRPEMDNALKLGLRYED